MNSRSDECRARSGLGARAGHDSRPRIRQKQRPAGHAVNSPSVTLRLLRHLAPDTKSHLASSQAKLGVRDRVEIAAWAWENRLMASGA